MPKAEHHSGQMVVLLAEDDAVVQNLVRDTLESNGYFVLTADDGQEALELSRYYPRRIDLLLTDYDMPRLDGLRLKSELQRDRPAVKVLLMSGDPPPNSVVATLPKPFRMQELLTRIQQILPHRPPSCPD